MSRPAYTEKRTLALALLVAGAACSFDPAYRDVPIKKVPICAAKEITCNGAKLARCADDGMSFQTTDDCGARGLVCAPTLLACTPCLPNDGSCDGQTTLTCTPDGQRWARGETCDTTKAIACRAGKCADLCRVATEQRSNVGCEYWGVDLDNAMVSASLNAAAQQYAIVVSNAEPDLPAYVMIEEDDAPSGQPAKLRTVATATIAPRNLEVFKLGPREVDGSPEGEFDTGTHTALTRHAYRVRSNVPIVAYQFNPLENVNVFSNDASQMLPTAAISGGYVVAGWPQTIARSMNPSQNFGEDLRAFLSIVGTENTTKVHIKSTARIVAGGPLPDGLAQGAEADVTIDAFDVLNLETGDFGADFTGTQITASGAVVVYSGSEASDAPMFQSLTERYCCADHLEEQVAPLRAVGKSYVLGRMPNRTRAVAAAGGSVASYDEPEYFRVIATGAGTTHVKTTLPTPDDAFELTGIGANRTLTSRQDFHLIADQPAIVAQVQGGQDSAGVPRGLPGGDPSLTFVAPVEQWRNDYVLLTPDKYAFDFLVVAAPRDAQLFIDGMRMGPETCEVAPGDGLTDVLRGKPAPTLIYRCQMSYPVIDTTKSAPDNVKPGKQNDGVHRIQSDRPVGVVAYGFDSYVSYAYCGGTQLVDLTVR